MDETEDESRRIRLEILAYSYWEHFKFEKDMARVLPLDHPRRVELRKHSNELLAELHAHEIRTENDGDK